MLMTDIMKTEALLGEILLSSIKTVPSLGAYALILKIEKKLRITTEIHGKVTVPAGCQRTAGGDIDAL